MHLAPPLRRSGSRSARNKPLKAAVALVLLFTACTNGGSSSSSSNGVKQGGVLRIGVYGTIDSPNPFVGFEQPSYDFWEYVYPQLDQYDTKTLQLEPEFATSWSHSSNGLTWTFHTQPNAKWSDGQPLTAADAAWTINTIIKFADGPTANLATDVAHMKSAEAPNATTLILHYEDPVANVLPNLQVVPILPQHVWSKYATGDGKALRTYPNTPQNGQPLVGGGPFELTQYQQDSLAIFQRNPNWYGPAPHIDGFGMEFFSNQDTMVQALKSGKIDAVGVYPLPPTSVATIKQPGIHVYEGPSLQWFDFIMNANTKKTTNTELLNPLVREAIDMSIDRQKIVQTAFLGYAQPGSSIIPPSTGSWYDPSIKPTPFDLAKANQLLDQAGYKKGSDGIRIANGHPMSYNVIFANDDAGAGDRAFQIMQQDFQQVGIQIHQKVEGPGPAQSAIEAPNNTYTTFDFAMWGWITLLDPDYILSVPTCGQFGSLNDSGYCNSAYDKLYAEQGTATNPAQRKAIVYKMQDMIYNSRAYMVLCYLDQLEAWSTKWTGFVESSQGFLNQFSKASLIDVHQV
jgi:peptide/nickel transport system substrate-binding protein